MPFLPVPLLFLRFQLCENVLQPALGQVSDSLNINTFQVLCFRSSQCSEKMWLQIPVSGTPGPCVVVSLDLGLHPQEKLVSSCRHGEPRKSSDFHGG